MAPCTGVIRPTVKAHVQPCLLLAAGLFHCGSILRCCACAIAEDVRTARATRPKRRIFAACVLLFRATATSGGGLPGLQSAPRLVASSAAEPASSDIGFGQRADVEDLGAAPAAAIELGLTSANPAHADPPVA